ncbi:MAG: hypothetical protein WCF05_05120 [Chromatiaceae bacterium]|jgi:hypothetical protein
MKRTRILAALLSLALLAPAFADEVAQKSIADIYKEKAELAGKPVKLQGKVVKVNNNIMNRNFLHLQDGSGDPAAGTNDLTITSGDTAAMGDTVTVTGTLAVDLDFGSGYKYPLLLEKATITPAP